MKGSDQRGQAAAPVGHRVLNHAAGLGPPSGRPQHVAQVGRHEVSVVPLLGSLGVVDALPQPVFGPRVLHQRRCTGAEHTVGPGGLTLPPSGAGAADGVLQAGPPLLAAAGVDQNGAQGRRRVQLGHLIAAGAGGGQGALPVHDRLLKSKVEHRRLRESSIEPSAHRLGHHCRRSCGRQHGQPLLEQSRPGGKAVPEQVPGSDQAREHLDRSERHLDVEQQLVCPREVLGGRGVIVGRRRFDSTGVQQSGKPLPMEVCWGAPNRPPIQGERFAMV